MSENKPKDDLIGKKISQYTILEVVGRGGMATVYRGIQTSMNRTVAIKVLPRHFLHDPGFLERFQREVDVIASLEHPHILPIYDYGETDGIPFIAMRYLAGGSMAQMIRRGIPNIEDLERPLTQLAQALDYAHQQGIIHRDLKPGNIMLDENGNAYLSDFGIARVMGSELTGSAIIGTPAYMSPEQANGFSIDARSDIYAIGIVLFELLTGREPYQAETPMAVLLKHISEPLPSPRDLRDEIPESIETVINKATEKNPDDRYASAGEMARAFSEALRPGAIRPTQPAESKQPTKKAKPFTEAGTITNVSDTPTQMQPTAAVDSGTDVVAAAPQTNRTPFYLAIALVVLLMLGGGGFALYFNQQVDAVNAQATAQMLAIIPTPFRNAAQIDQPEYRITIPNDWLPPAADFNDLSDANRLMHSWREEDDEVIVSLQIFEPGTPPRADIERRYDGRAGLTAIPEPPANQTAPDGTLRLSFRVQPNDRFPETGQLDVFIMEKAQRLVVLEFYTADAVGVERSIQGILQLILDSLQIKPAA